MGVKVSSLQMENNTIYLSLVCSACPSFIAYSVIYIKREYFIAVVVYKPCCNHRHVPLKYPTIFKDRFEFLCSHFYIQHLTSNMPSKNYSTRV